MAESIALATDASRQASLLLSYIPAVCAFVAPRLPGASAAIIDRLSHSRALVEFDALCRRRLRRHLLRSVTIKTNCWERSSRCYAARLRCARRARGAAARPATALARAAHVAATAAVFRIALQIDALFAATGLSRAACRRTAGPRFRDVALVTGLRAGLRLSAAARPEREQRKQRASRAERPPDSPQTHRLPTVRGIERAR